MSNLFNVFKHLFPRAAAWLLPYDGDLRKYIEGLSEYPQDIREEADNVFLDIFPQATRELERWEKQFGLTDKGTEQERRDNLDGRWKAQGGQGIDYLESVIHAAGFTDVYLHPWWNSDGSTKNPNYYISGTNPGYLNQFGRTRSQFGRNQSQFGGIVPPSALYLNQFGRDRTQFGRTKAQFGGNLPAPDGFLLVNKGPGIEYSVPTTVANWREMIYVGAEVFPNFVAVSITRRDEFERLLLKYLPYSHWIGMLINYV